ncbi:hypothetical protein DFJ74DRAFT_757050 [Hyaloraphidium curvatum]|nr:hypothetical protein DFJ74DRAFT_757050 [Hyaloraphidium curvatum]
MASGKKKTTKGEKMSLTDFLAAQPSSGASWADDVEDLPTGSSGNSGFSRGDASRPLGVQERGYGDRYGGERDRPPSRYPVSDRAGPGGSDDMWRSRGPPPERDYPPARSADREYRAPERERRPFPSEGGAKSLPDRPPFTAYVGNLPFSANERDVTDFFDPLKLTSVRIVKDHEGQSKGFGYVEFETKADLVSALEGDGTPYQGRPVRIDVAEPRERDRGGFGGFGGEDRTTGDWRSSAAPQNLPPVRREPSGREGDRYGFGSRDSLRDSPRSPVSRYGPPLSRDGSGESELPKERKKLDLKPRSGTGAAAEGGSSDGPSSAEPSPSAAAPPKKKSDPFGGARPVDVTSVEKRVEEKLKQKQLEDKQRLEEQRAKRAEAAAAEEARKGARDGKRSVAGDKGHGEHGEHGEQQHVPAKSEAATSWRSAQTPDAERTRSTSSSNWETSKKAKDAGNEKQSGTPEPSQTAEPAATKSKGDVDELVPKVNSFGLLADEVGIVPCVDAHGELIGLPGDGAGRRKGGASLDPLGRQHLPESRVSDSRVA